MTLEQARSIVRTYARNAQDGTVYTDEEVESAIRSVGEQFCRSTKYLRATASASLTDGSPSFTMTATDFLPERIEDVLVSTIAEPLRLEDYRTVHEAVTDDTAESEPEMVGFLNDTQGKVYPTPGSNYTMIVSYWQPFTTYTPGGTSGATTLNLPDHVLYQILPKGPPALLQHSAPEHRYTSEAWKEYMRIEASFRGGGNLGARNIIRNRTHNRQPAKLRSVG